MASTTATLLLLLLLTLSSGVSKPPNFVFLMADDLGYGDVQYNGGNASTPNLDSLAAGPNSLRLTRYYSGGPVCSPTRGTLLTGRNHNRYCVWTANAGNTCPDFACPEGMPLPSSEVTVGEILREHGYRTAAFGKWHLGDLKPLPRGNPKWPVSRPDQHGFQEWWVTERSAPSTSLNCACFNTSLCPLGHYSSPPPCTNYYSLAPGGILEGLTQPYEGDDSHFLLKLFQNFLENVTQTGEPFFIYVPFHTVHIRYIASMGYIERYMNKGYSLDQIDYYGAITAMDDVVGKIRQLLKQYSLSNNTMLWFVSDNGPFRKSPGYAGGFRGWKAQLYEGGIRVPGIIEWPDMIKSNRVSDYAVVSSDFLPTVCDILGTQPPSDRPIDGTSIMPLLRNERSTRNKTISWAFNIHGNFNGTYNAAISGDQFKVYSTYSEGEVKTAELYDLINDPSETTDISAKYPEILHSLEQTMEEWMESVHQSTQTVGCLGVSKQNECSCR